LRPENIKKPIKDPDLFFLRDKCSYKLVPKYKDE